LISSHFTCILSYCVLFFRISSHFTCILSHIVRFRMKFVLTLVPHFGQNMHFIAFSMIWSHSTCILSYFVWFCPISSHFEWNLPTPFYHTSEKNALCRILFDLITFHMHSITLCIYTSMKTHPLTSLQRKRNAALPEH
jgi:hypothetical protein